MIIESYADITLNSIIDTISLPESLYDKINTRYENIGKWLHREESRIHNLDPKIYCQGSMRIGTAIKPLLNGCYDVDLVCQIKFNHKKISPKIFKELIGQEINEYMTSYNMSANIQESKRCWTVEYADEVSFHVDILPSILDEFNEAQVKQWVDSAIIITDNTFSGYNNIPGEWAYSNPIGFSEWLKETEIDIFLNKEKEQLLKKSLEKIPEYSIITPLRKSIMLLKRHRDVYFKDNPEFKPSSVLITTLAGLTYSGTNIESTWDSIQYIVSNMEKKILNNNGKLCVFNPANCLENFADKWNNKKELKEHFFSWIKQLKTDIKTIYSFEQSLSPSSTNNLVVKSMDEHIQFLYEQEHRKNLPFEEITTSYTCHINKAYIYRKGFRKNKIFYKSGDFFPKGFFVDFEVTTDVPKPYTVYWQIINSGEEAIKDYNLRGNYFQDNNLSHREFTKYKGIHSIQCFILKGHEIVVKSKPFIAIIN
jgi:hypothetical protein